MGWKNLIVGSNELHSVAKSYVNVFNDISTFVKTAPPTNINTNEINLTQYSTKKVLNVFGNKIKTAVRKELHQFHDRRVVKPKKPQYLSHEHKIRSLEYLMFMKLENDEVTIKGRGCKCVSKHWDYLSK